MTTQVALPVRGRIAALPRRSFVGDAARSARTQMSRGRTQRADATVLFTLSRLALWLFGGLWFLGGTALDVVRRRSSVARRATRMREIMERMGPTFIKLGQQLSIRADILPYAYCTELAKMLDKVPPFPVEQAIAVVERNAGLPIDEVYASFDRNPIGSASIGCVYKAVLHSGETVAVKVRRPGIGRLFAADLRALSWLLGALELGTILRPGQTRELLIELKIMLFEELNYRLEGRYTELFGKRARKKKQAYLSAPKVYFDLSADDVLVTQFVQGVFLSELLAAIDANDEVALARLRARGIDPQEVARHMMRAFYWATLENIFFHADPHPANIVVREGGGGLILIDFGSCGRFSTRIRRAYIRFQNYVALEDVVGMTEAAMSMLEPLPHLDVERLTREIEGLFWDWLYATKSKTSEWWERATGQIWMRFIGIAQRYGIPVTLDLLRMFRATFLYDSIAMRLWNRLDMNDEFREYMKERGRRTRRVIRRAYERRVEEGPTAKDYLLLEEFERVGTKVVARVQEYLDKPEHRFFGILGKAAYAASLGLRLLLIGIATHVTALLVVLGIQRIRGVESFTAGQALGIITDNPLYQGALVVVALVVLRKAIVRLDDMDIDK